MLELKNAQTSIIDQHKIGARTMEIDHRSVEYTFMVKCCPQTLNDATCGSRFVLMVRRPWRAIGASADKCLHRHRILLYSVSTLSLRPRSRRPVFISSIWCGSIPALGAISTRTEMVTPSAWANCDRTFV